MDSVLVCSEAMVAAGFGPALHLPNEMTPNVHISAVCYHADCIELVPTL